MARRTNADLAFDDARLRIIAEVYAKPVFAEVYWDYNADAWAIECRPCGIEPRVATEDAYHLINKAIKLVLTNEAVRHNKKHHGVS